jgi:hypothetical protein
MFCPLFSLPSPEEGLTSDRSVAGSVGHVDATGSGLDHKIGGESGYWKLLPSTAR